MTDPTSRLLADQLGRLAGKGGLGARLVARFLPNNVGEAEFAVSESPEKVRERAQSLIQGRGRLLAPSELPRDPNLLAGLVGAGGLSLNPTVVTIRVSATVSL